MTQWTEQPDGTWRRGPLVVHRSPIEPFWNWDAGDPDGGPVGSGSTREEAQQAADAWAANMLAQLKQLDTPSNPGQIDAGPPCATTKSTVES